MIVLLSTIILVFLVVLSAFAVFNNEHDDGPISSQPDDPPEADSGPSQEPDADGPNASEDPPATTPPKTSASKNQGEVSAPEADKVTGDEVKAEEEGPPSKESAASQTRVLKQCYLISRINDLIDYRYSVQMPKDDAWPGYHNLTTLNAPPNLTLSELVGKKNVESIWDIRDHQIALLVPRIRFFKVLMSGPNVVQEIEFPFQNSARLDPLAPQIQPGNQVGIKSFSYDLAGTNPAEAENLIKASATFYFASLDDLFARFETEAAQGTDYKEGQSVEVTSTETHSYSFSDLIIYNNKADTYNDEFFTIRAQVGWSTPGVGEDLIDKTLKQAIMNSQTSLLLQLTGHELTLNQDGSLNLEVEYIARLEAGLANNALNILWIPQTSAIIKAREAIIRERKSKTSNAKEIAELQEVEKYYRNIDEDKANVYNTTINKYKDRVANLAGRLREGHLQGGGAKVEAQKVGDASVITFGGPSAAERKANAAAHWRESSKEHGEEIDKQIEKLEREVSRFEGLSRIKRYRRILLGLTERNRIFTIKTTANEMGIFDQEQELGQWKNRSITGRTGKISQGDEDNVAGKADAKLQEQVNEQTKKKPRQKGDEIVLITDDQEKIDESSEVRIPFFYFGDLIDILIQILKDEIDGKHNEKAIATLSQLTILLGSLVLTRDVEGSSTGEQRTINLSDFPISLNLFLIWFQDNLIKTQRPVYTLTNIFRDVLSTLVVASLGQGCYGGLKQSVQPGMLPVTSRKAEGDHPRIPQRGARCRIADLKEATNLEAEQVVQTAQKTQNILFFYGKEDQINYLNGDEGEHNQRGIYHLRIGRNRGLIKNISFSKTDFAFQREARITNQADETALDGYLREKYDANITMVGNNLFHPGQMIYIDPQVPGATKGQARLLGFSGYYFVHEVFHLSEAQYYQTEIKAIHQGFPMAGPAINASIPPSLNPSTAGAYSCIGRDLKWPKGYIEANSADPNKRALSTTEKFLKENPTVGKILQVGAGIVANTIGGGGTGAAAQEVVVPIVVKIGNKITGEDE